MAGVVGGGSHLQPTPHPSLSPTETKARMSGGETGPTSAAEAAIKSYLACRFHKYLTLYRNTTKKAPKATQAAGTCTYMIFCRCPISRSAGERMKADAWAKTKNRTVKAPNRDSHFGFGGTTALAA